MFMDEVEEIKRRLDIADVIGGYIQLKPAGRNRKGVCPFHQEKTPSFMVSPEKGIWHCFGCELGGDIFGFVMKMEGLEFRDALELLAKKAGVELKPRGGSAKTGEFKKRLYAAMELAVRYYQETLIKNPTALGYLKSRGITKQAIKDFQIGYAPDSWEALTQFLLNKRFNQEELIKSGLATKNARGLRDLFRSRIMLPVCDNQGRPVGFSARLIEDDGKSGPKYLNTPETMLYNKSHLIYGLHLAKDAIRENDEAVFVEGNLDVIASHQTGVEQAVASSGTALTADQLRTISRLAKNVKLAFDEDQAGLAATERSIELAQGLDITVKIIELKGAKDPDELIKRDPKLWQQAVGEARYAMDYLFDRLKAQFDLNTALGKKQFSTRMAQVVSRLSDPVEREHYAKLVADLTGVSADAVTKKLTPQTNKSNLPSEDKLDLQKKDAQAEVEDSLLSIVLAFAETRDGLGQLSKGLFSSSERQQIWHAVAHDPKSRDVQIAQGLPELADYVKILGLRGEEEYQDTAPANRKAEAYNLARRLQDIVTKQRIHELTSEIKQAEQTGDHTRRDALLAKVQSINQGEF